GGAGAHAGRVPDPHAGFAHAGQHAVADVVDAPAAARRGGRRAPRTRTGILRPPAHRAPQSLHHPVATTPMKRVACCVLLVVMASTIAACGETSGPSAAELAAQDKRVLAAGRANAAQARVAAAAHQLKKRR